MIDRYEPHGQIVPPPGHHATMLLGSDRIFFTGRFRRSIKARKLGAVSIYAVPGTPFDISIGDSPRQSCSIVAVPAYMPHKILPPRGPIWNLLLEPESLSDEVIENVMELCNGPSRLATLERMRSAEAQLTPGDHADRFTTPAFDRLFFGMPLPARLMDPRAMTVLRLLSEDEQQSDETMLSAEACAMAVNLSTSRLLHLFRQETGVSFRLCRMWKRARRFLDQAAGNASLTDVALGLGYPDSSHFSHSIRRTFGMQPGVMREGLRGMHIWPGGPVVLKP